MTDLVSPKPELLALDHLQLAMPAGGEGAARSFYGGLLGLEEVPKPAALAARGGVWFAGPVGVHLGVEEGFRAARKAHPAFRVEDLPAWAVHLTAAGVPFESDHTWEGERRLYLADPFGNRLEFLQHRPAAGGAIRVAEGVQ